MKEKKKKTLIDRRERKTLGIMEEKEGIMKESNRKRTEKKGTQVECTEKGGLPRSEKKKKNHNTDSNYIADIILRLD